jgi:hypothetical protein
LEHLHDDDRGEPAERRIQTSPDRLQLDRCCIPPPPDKWENGELCAELGQEGGVQRRAVVRERHRAEQLAESVYPLQVEVGEAKSRPRESMGEEPSAERGGRPHLIGARFDVEGVDELLHEPEIPGRRRPPAGLDRALR